MMVYQGVPPAVSAPKVKGPMSKEDMVKKAQEVPSRPAGSPPSAEITLHLGEYRAVDGIQLPHQLSFAVSGDLREQWDTTSVKVNGTVKRERFRGKQ
jgi:hypothetical protein